MLIYKYRKNIIFEKKSLSTGLMIKQIKFNKNTKFFFNMKLNYIKKIIRKKMLYQQALFKNKRKKTKLISLFSIIFIFLIYIFIINFNFFAINKFFI